MNILWVENHLRFARLAVRQFLADHAVTIVPTLAGARLALSNTPFDVVLIDHDLDDGKGVELVRELRRDARPRIIATSALDDGNRALMAAGADAVCGKLQFHQVAEVLAAFTSPDKAAMPAEPPC